MDLEKADHSSPIHQDAEYTAFNEGSREALWIRQLLLDIEDTPAGKITIYADNQAALARIPGNDGVDHRPRATRATLSTTSWEGR